jgi:hypothetical protein
MPEPLVQIWNKHATSCGEPPTITNQATNQYIGYFQNRHGEQWVFVYHRERKVGELRGGDIGWDTVVVVRDGHADVTLGSDEAVWLQACWEAAAGTP